MRTGAIYFSLLLSVGLSDTGNAKVALVFGPQPCEGPFVFTCTASEDTPQMRVSVQSPTQTLPVERTLSSLNDDISYGVELDPAKDDLNIAVRLSVTIREVSDHVGTKYHCVQHHDDGTIRSQELVINCSATPMPPTTTSVLPEEHGAVSMNITVSQQWGVEDDSWSVGIQWKVAVPVNANNITVTRLCYPSGRGSEEQKVVAPTGEMTTLLVPPYVHNCFVVVEMLQGDRVLAVGRTSFEIVDEVPTEGIAPGIMQLNAPKKSSQQHMSPLTVVLSVVGACLFSALVLFVVLLSVGLCVHYKKRRSRPSTSGEQSEPICDSVRSWSPASSATNPIYVNGNSDGGITVKDNPSYVLHVYAQINPTLSTRPRPIPPGHPSTYNTSDSPSDPDYI